MPQANPLDEYETIKSTLEKYPDIFETEHQLRWILRFRESNGLGDSVKKIGHRLLIHRPGLERFISNRRA